MSDRPPSVVHVTPHVQARGGTETLHAYHRHLPGEQVFVALFDRDPEARPGYVNLGFTWRTPLGEMRRRFARAFAPLAGRVVIYHDGWGLPFFQDLDGAGRRLVVLHSDPAYHAAALPGLAGLIDGALAISPAVQAAVAAALPALAGDRVRATRVPIELPPARVARAAGGPLILGYAGRIERAQKRLDRLPGFLRALRAAGVDFRFELIGDGTYRPALERELAGQAHLHGWVTRAEYRRIMAGWDAVVFFSDHEGGPISLLEGMAAGALPFYPAQGGSWADVYAPRVDPLCHYPPADLPALARAIQTIFQRPAAQLEQLRARSRELVLAHSPENYLADCSDFIGRVAAAERISGSPSRTPRVSDLLPLGWVTRMAPGLLNRR
jgi:glycosyltransferase involved in cell wall biosynthesis